MLRRARRALPGPDFAVGIDPMVADLEVPAEVRAGDQAVLVLDLGLVFDDVELDALAMVQHVGPDETLALA